MTSDFAPEVAKYPQNPKTFKTPKPPKAQLIKIGTKFRRPNRKSGSPSKNPTSDFALEVAKSPKIAPSPKIAQNGDLEN